MSYDAQEVSTEGGQPVEAYTFTIGATSYRYTSSEDTVQIASIDYTPVPIKRSEIKRDGVRGAEDVTITLPSDNAVAQLYAGVLPGDRVGVTISRFHRGDTPTPEVVTAFTGYVTNVSFDSDANEAIFTASPDMIALSKSTPAYGYQSQCNHVLYGAACGVSEGSYQLAGASVSSVTGYDVEVPSASAFADGYFTGGFVSTTGAATDYRMVIAHVGSTLTLMFPFPSDPSTLDVFAGCDHTLATCKSKFDNVVNFGGYAFVPTRNPFSVGIV